MEAVIICRCEEVQKEDVLQAVLLGASTPNDVKRMTRCGAGACQAKTCMTLVADLIQEATGRSMGEIGIVRQRIPTRPIPVAILASDMDKDDDVTAQKRGK